MTLIRNQKSPSMLEMLIESVRNAYFSGSSALMEAISEIILELVSQNQLFIRKHRGKEVVSIKKTKPTILKPRLTNYALTISNKKEKSNRMG